MPLERYTTGRSSLRVQALKGLVWIPRFYCDDSNWTGYADADKPYLSKAPIVKLTVTPPVRFVNEFFDWDISASFSASSTLQDFSISWNGPSNITDISNADWNTAPKTGQVSYSAIGVYVVEATVRDILNERSQVGSVAVEVINRAQSIYIATNDQGVWTFDSDLATDPIQSSSGLTGDFLKVRDLKVYPLTRERIRTLQEIWIATLGGPAFSNDGGSSWTTFPLAGLPAPENEVADNPPPVNTDLDCIAVAFSPTDPSLIAVTMRTKLSLTAANKRLWIYWTTNKGQSWSNQQIPF